MSYPTNRIQLYDKDCNPLRELAPKEVLSRVRHEKINDEHTLEIQTTRILQVGWRALTVDDMGIWREWVVEEPDELHDAGKCEVGTYRLVWSVQYDLTHTYDESLKYDSTGRLVNNLAHAEVGMDSVGYPRQAIEAAIRGSKKWTFGRSDVSPVQRGKGVVMIANCAWDRLSQVVEAWGGELQVRITVDQTGVTKREIDLMEPPVLTLEEDLDDDPEPYVPPIVPDETIVLADDLIVLADDDPIVLADYEPEIIPKKKSALTPSTRRFEWGTDLTSIRRKPDPGPYYCRVVPIGKGETEYANVGPNPLDDEIEYEWPMGLLDDLEYWPQDGDDVKYWVQGTEYLEDPKAALAFRVSDGKGGWEYPTTVVKYDADDTQLLYEAAREDLFNHTRPKVTYEASVSQFAAAGMDVHGVALGDVVDIVDRGFNPEVSLALRERVVEMTVDELDDFRTEIVIGTSQESLIDKLADVEHMESAVEKIDFLSTDAYVLDLLKRVNEQLNATGGYAYMVPGKGIMTYDRAVTDPEVGTEAGQAVQVGGGFIRFANSKTPGGDWDWKNVITADGYLGLAATIARITSGYIGNPAGNCYWDLDAGLLVIGKPDGVPIHYGDGVHIDCNYADVTNIDGGRIKTNTITAAQIKAHSITTDLLNAEEIRANLIRATTINCDQLSGGTIDGQTINGGKIVGAKITGGEFVTTGALTKLRITEGRIELSSPLFPNRSPIQIGNASASSSGNHLWIGATSGNVPTFSISEEIVALNVPGRIYLSMTRDGMFVDTNGDVDSSNLHPIHVSTSGNLELASDMTRVREYYGGPTYTLKNYIRRVVGI